MMTTAFVFSGGGSLGAVQAGMVLALAEAGVEPDFVVGASVGSINAASFAAHPDLDGARRLVDIWKQARRDDVFPLQLVNGFLGFVGLHDSLLSADAFRAMLQRNLDIDRLEDAQIPIHLIAADLATGQEVVLSRGGVLETLCASSAIPGIFPPVEIDGRTLVDGGVVNNAPVSVAVAEGADTIYVLPTGYACASETRPRAAFSVMMQALTLMVHTRLAIDVERYRDQCDLRVLPPLCPLDVLPVDFGHTAELIDRAHDQTKKWIENGSKRGRRTQVDVLGLHAHHADGTVTMSGTVHASGRAVKSPEPAAVTI